MRAVATVALMLLLAMPAHGQQIIRCQATSWKGPLATFGRAPGESGRFAFW